MPERNKRHCNISEGHLSAAEAAFATRVSVFYFAGVSRVHPTHGKDLSFTQDPIVLLHIDIAVLQFNVQSYVMQCTQYGDLQRCMLVVSQCLCYIFCVKRHFCLELLYTVAVHVYSYQSGGFAMFSRSR